MSAKIEHNLASEISGPTPIKKKYLLKTVLITTAILSPIIIAVIALYIYGTNIHNEERIYPNIMIAGTDVSGMTRFEAMQSLGLHVYEERIDNTMISVKFPDETTFTVTGNDVEMQHNARDMVNIAYSLGREHNNVILDAISYIQRIYINEPINLNFEVQINTDLLFDIIASITDEYNSRLNASEPVIYEDKFIFTKGVGYITADASVIFELADIGLFKSLYTGEPVEIIYELTDTNKFVAEIIDIHESIFTEMISSEFDPESISATVSAIGVDFDKIAAVELIRDTEPGKSAVIYFDFTHPEYSQEHLESLLFRDLLGTRTTWAHGDSYRLENIRLSAEAINGLILLPDEEFSFNGVVGQRTEARGYKPAPSLLRGETVTTVGGGICQTSSTLYAAIKPTDLLVTEQQKHGRPVPYLPWGWDATVYWNYLDFKFVNNTNYPIRIDIKLDDRDVTAEVRGTIIDDFPVKEGWNG